MRYWWVNQNQTYKHEIAGGYLWSPKTRADGHRHYFYETMTQAAPGDLVFSFYDTKIQALGIVDAAATSAPKPTEFGSAGAAWSQEGWLVAVSFLLLKQRIRPKDHMSTLRPLLPQKYSPLQASGDGNQVVYLTELSELLALSLGGLIGPEFSGAQNDADNACTETAKDSEEKELWKRTDIGETTKLQLTKSRRGQGLFRSRVELVEPACRLTHVTDRQHLRASHIKPWSVCSDQEKLDGYNGLMLSPHVDHLFDRGFISFKDNGEPLVASKLDVGVMQSWGLSTNQHIQPFNPQQLPYLAHHRAKVFLGQ